MKSIKAMLISIASILIFMQSAMADGEPSADCIKNTEVLNALGIIQVKRESINEERKVSRTEFCDAIANMMHEGEYIGVPYADMSESNSGMLFLKDMNILDGNDEGQFLPNKIITVDEAVKIAVKALGFAPSAEYSGGWTKGYMSAAADIDLLSGLDIKNSSELDFGNFARLIKNTADTDILSMKSYGISSTYEREEGVTLLSKYRNIRKDKGIVAADGFTGLYSARNGAGTGNVMINEEIYSCESYDAEKLLGYFAEYYYNDDTNVLLYAGEYRNRNNVLNIKSGDIEAYNNGEYSYTDASGRRKSAYINNNTSIIYNGVFADVNDVFVPETGGVTFLDNNNDGKYEVLFINDVRIIAAESVDTEKERITDKYDSSLNISLKGCGGVRITDENGEKKQLDFINDGDVLEVKKSAANDCYEIKVVRQAVSGTVDSVSKNGDKYDKLTVSTDTEKAEYDTSYRMNELAAKGDIKEIVPGNSYMFYLTSGGEIAYITTEQALTGRIGYLRKFIESDKNLDDNPRVKILDQTGAWELYELGDNVKINGGSVKSKNLAASAVKINTICKYSINIHGRVTSIDFPDAVENSIKTTFTGESVILKRMNTGYAFGKNSNTDTKIGYVSEKAYVFIIPAGETEQNSGDECRTVTGIGDITISGSNPYNVEIYNSEGELDAADAVLIKTTNKFGFARANKRRPVAINNILKGVNDDDEIRYFAQCLADGNEVTVTIDDKRSNTSAPLPFGAGDIIMYSPAQNGELVLHDDEKSYAVLLKYNDGSCILSAGNSSKDKKGEFELTYGKSLSSSCMIRFGDVYKTKGKTVFINESGDITNNDSLLILNCASSNVYTYNKRTKEFETGEVSDAVGYKDGVSDYSRVFAAVNEGYSYLVIYPQ